MLKIADFSNRIPIAVLPVVVVLVFIISLYEVLVKLSYRLGGGDFDYCYLVPFVFAYLLWDMRHRGAAGNAERASREETPEAGGVHKDVNADGVGFKFGKFTWSIWGLVPITLSILFIFAGELGSVETLMYIGIWGNLFGIGCFLYGRRLRKLGFAFLILLFIVPLPHYINQVLTFQLRLSASTIAAEMLTFTGASVFQEGNIIDIGATQLQVVDACSGLRYLMPLLLLSLLVGHFFSRSWWRKAFLVSFVVPLTTFLNAFRIWLTGILTIMGHAELAQDFFHDLSGWLIFVIAGAILYGAAMMLNRFGPEGVEKRVTDSGARSIGIFRPVMLSVAICLLFVGSGWALKQVPSAGNLPQRATLDRFPMQIGVWEGKRGYIPQEDLDSLWADDYVMGTFARDGLRNTIYLLIPFYAYQGTMHTAHAPQACLLGSGWAKLTSSDRLARVGDGRGISIQTMLMEKGGSRMLASYFFFQRGRVLTDPWLNKAYLFWDAVTRRRTDGALVRVEMTLAPGQTEEQAFSILEEFIAELWKMLPAYIPL
jgi:exosortase D (VPLPA-CTERM-specific)